jgi:3-phosphoshikimate 1-carboxyvinyltransferase
VPEQTAPWSAPQSSGFRARVEVPGSKSLTNRELILSALATGPSVLISPLVSRDTELMISALGLLGTEFEWQGHNLLVTPRPLSGGVKIDCGLAGTVMRFVPPMAALASGRVEFDGDAQARLRPMITTIDSLTDLGVEVEAERKALPFTLIGKGSIPGGRLEIDASASSQFVSGLLLSAPRYESGLDLHHVGNKLPSLPHIEMTIACLRARGAQVEQRGDSNWVVEAGEIAGREVVIEPDLSNAGPFLAAALVTGGEVTIPRWPSETTQVGKLFEDYLAQMGAEVTNSGGELTVRGTGIIRGIDADLSGAGELTPTIAAVAALADSPSRLTGIAHLRGHETDRIAALVAEINGIGGLASELEDGIAISPANLQGGLWHTYADHRMATAGAIIGLTVPGIEVEDISVTTKTLPEFSNLWQQMLESN